MKKFSFYFYATSNAYSNIDHASIPIFGENEALAGFFYLIIKDNISTHGVKVPKYFFR